MATCAPSARASWCAARNRHAPHRVAVGGGARAETLSEERVIKEGQQVLILPQGLQASEAAPALAGAWAQGMLVVENARLADLVAELGRYSPALLQVDPSIADLRVTGSFPLKDTRLALQALEPSLPVRSVRHNAWWFEVVPR